MRTIADQLRVARALIDTPEKWIKGSFCDMHGRHCAVGALGHTDADALSYQALNDVVGGHPITSWNDNRQRTHEDVMDAFDRAIALAEEWR